MINVNCIERMPYENNQNFIYRVLEENILELYLEPGERISETELAQSFASSRSPIRSALSRLNEEGFVIIEPQKITTVAKLDKEYILQAGFAKYVIESELMADIIKAGKADVLCSELSQALEKFEISDAYSLRLADEQFHSKIYEIAGREKLMSCMHVPYLHYCRIQSLQRRIEVKNGDFILNHRKLIDLIEHKDLNALEQRKRSRLERLDSIIMDAMREYPQYFC